MAQKSPSRGTRKKSAPPASKVSAGRNRGSRAGKKRPPRNHLHCISFLLVLAVLLTIFAGLVLSLFVLLDVPRIQSIHDYAPKMTTRILATDRELVEEIFQENRRVVSLDSMGPLLPQAFVAAEDSRFYEHPGVDLLSVFRALFRNIRAGARAQGGSTITQQVTRSLLLSRKKLYSRKIREAILAYRIDSMLRKDEILAIYLNQIYLGEGAHGVAAAAHTYFNKPVQRLSLGQVALLAGLPQAPSRYSPFRDMDAARKRQAYVLNRMAEEGYITVEAARRAYDEPLSLQRPHDPGFPGAAYYVQQVENYVRQKYGQERLATGGLTIYTFLDRRLQQEATAVVRRGLAAQPFRSRQGQGVQGAMVVMEPRTGRVRAVVGGVAFAKSQFDRALQARRQPGSAFKPVVYAAALEHGFRPDSILLDEPLTLPGASRNTPWKPKNFDNRYNGPTTLAEGLIHSRNIVAVRLLQEIGIERAVRMAGKLGIRAALKKDLTLALGSSGVSLLEMTAAYSAFANRGRYSPPLFIDRIVDRHGNIISGNSPQKVKAMSEKTAAQVDRMLQEVISRGTGKRARGLGQGSAGKTGTTDNVAHIGIAGITSPGALRVEASLSEDDLSPFPFPEDDFDRGFIKFQPLAETVDEVAVVGEVDFFGIVGDNGKGGRPARYLGGVEELNASAPVQ
jgi:penicillin-binding protein 1A